MNAPPCSGLHRQLPRLFFLNRRRLRVVVTTAVAFLAGVVPLVSLASFFFIFLSSFATLFAFGRARLVQPVLTERQDAEIRFFFDVDTAAAGFHVIDDWAAAFRFKWEFPFGYKEDLFYNFSRLDSDPRLRLGRTITIGPYPNEVSAYLKYLPSLRSLLRPKRRFLQEAEKRRNESIGFYLAANSLPGEKEEEVNIVGVHVRLADYSWQLQKLYNATPVGPDYFARAMEHFREKVPHPVFLFVSNEADAVRRMVSTFKASQGECQTHGNCFFFGPSAEDGRRVHLSRSAAVDLTLLTLCRHFVLTHGTFGMWGAFLSGAHGTKGGGGTPERMVVMPAGYDGIKEVREIDRAGLDWIRI